MQVPKDVLRFHRRDNKPQKAGNMGALIVHKFMFCRHENVTHKVSNLRFHVKAVPKNKMMLPEKKERSAGWTFFLHQLEDWTLDTLNEKLVICETMYE